MSQTLEEMDPPLAPDHDSPPLIHTLQRHMILGLDFLGVVLALYGSALFGLTRYISGTLGT